MKKFALSIIMLLSAGMLFAQQQVELSNTYDVKGMSLSDKIVRAAHTVPTTAQLEALRNEYIAFIHFGPNTFTRLEWGNGKEDPKIFDLKKLDTDQWCSAMKEAGMKMVIFTAKHHDGFVLWQSRYTNHGVMATHFEDGKGDIMRNLAASCKKYGLKLGVYLSPADLFQIENEEGLYGNLSKQTMRTIPRTVEGRPFKDKRTFEFMVDDYNEYFLNQLFELLTEYGEICEVWFDGAHPKRKGGQTYNYTAWQHLIRELAPNAVIFGKEDIRWCGNESGATRPIERNVVAYNDNPHSMQSFPDMTSKDLGSREVLNGAKYIHYQQAEINTSIRAGWFYRDDTHQSVRSADDVFDIYERSVGGNATFLLNIPPNRDGELSMQDVGVLREVGQRIRATYDNDLLLGSDINTLLSDNNDMTYIELSDNNNEIVVKLPKPITLNRIVIQEAISTHSERVEKLIVDVWVGDKWNEVATCGVVGYKAILRFNDTTTDAIRIRVTESRLNAAISTLSAHYYNAPPPSLESVQDVNGMVTIKPKIHQFNWKPHGEDTAGNLVGEYKIYYTTDGSEPTTNSKLYTAPFMMNSGTLKAFTQLGAKKGSIYTQQMEWAKNRWKISATTGNEFAPLAIDADNRSYMLARKSDGEDAIIIDLGTKKVISGITYTPSIHGKKGCITHAKLYVSNNAKRWRKVGDINFGNIINDPSKRSYHLPNSSNSRYVKIVVEDTAYADDDTITINEIGIF